MTNLLHSLGWGIGAKERTWYWKYTKAHIYPFPKNWIVGTPIRLFGKVIAIKWKIAKSNYKWNKI